MVPIDNISKRIIAVAILFFAITGFVFLLSSITKANAAPVSYSSIKAICISPDGKMIYYANDNGLHKAEVSDINY